MICSQIRTIRCGSYTTRVASNGIFDNFGAEMSTWTASDCSTVDVIREQLSNHIYSWNAFQRAGESSTLLARSTYYISFISCLNTLSINFSVSLFCPFLLQCVQLNLAHKIEPLASQQNKFDECEARNR